MANINLNKLYKRQSDIKSPVDSKIQLNKATTDKEYWGDLRLDMSFNEIKERPLNAKESTKDIQRIINEESVIVALRNLFNTHSCSRLLNPEIDFNLSQYLFSPINTTTAWFLGYDLLHFFPQYEPRVRVTNVVVIARPNESMYEIKMTMSIPNVSDQEFSISSILSEDGFVILH